MFFRRMIVASFFVCMTAIGSPVRVIDGDTFIAVVEVRSPSVWLNGTVLSATFLDRIRVLHVNSPEMKGDTLAKGIEARNFTVAWLGCTDAFSCKNAKFVTLCSDKYDSFGRVLSTVKRDDGHDLADDLIASGNGVVYNP